MATLSLRNIRKAYGPAEVIKGVDLEIEDREFVVFVGPSGCGKSTLLRMIAGLEPITSGELQIDGVRVNERGPADRGLAMVFQSYALYPHMTVAQNMGFALKLAKVPAAERDRKVREAARILQLEPYLERRPKDLSGGQRQRVAIGRAIVRAPKVFLFDEPLSNLDAALRGQTRIEIARLHEELGATMIYVTHDQIEAMTLADKIVVLQAGRIEQVGSPLELYHHPANMFVAGFIGSPRMNMLPVTVVRGFPAQTPDGIILRDGVDVQLPSGAVLNVPVAGNPAVGTQLTLGLRPEALRPDPDGQLVGTVKLVERLGGLTLLHVETEGREDVIVQIEGLSMLGINHPVRLSADAASLHLFDGAGLALPALNRHSLVA